MRLLAAIALLGALARAEVLESGAGGFSVKTTLAIKAPPADVYRAFVEHVGDWWNSAHTFSQDAHNLSFEARPGGCFCEKLPENGFTRHMSVITMVPSHRIVLSGALGPMQTLGVTGTMLIQFTAEGGTKFEATYRVSGFLEKGVDSWALPVDMMTSEQFHRLKSYIETGKPGSK